MAGAAALRWSSWAGTVRTGVGGPWRGLGAARLRGCAWPGAWDGGCPPQSASHTQFARMQGEVLKSAYGSQLGPKSRGYEMCNNTKCVWKGFVLQNAYGAVSCLSEHARIYICLSH